MSEKTIKIPLYFGQIKIIQVKDLKSIEKKYGLHSLHGMEACCFRDHKKNGYSTYVIAFESECNARQIAHEALHEVALIYEDRGIKLDIENDEPQCYLLGWIVGECHKYLKIDNSRL